MGHTPHRARRNLRSLAAFALLTLTLAFVSAASGKKPDGAQWAGDAAGQQHGHGNSGGNGGGNGHGNGHGNPHGAQPTAPAPAAPPPPAPVPAPQPAPAPAGPGNSHGHGHANGNGNGHGNGRGHNEPTVTVPQEPAKQSSTPPSAPSPSAGTPAPAPAPAPQPASQPPTPTGSLPPKGATRGGTLTGGAGGTRARARGPRAATLARRRGAPAARAAGLPGAPGIAAPTLTGPATALATGPAGSNAGTDPARDDTPAGKSREPANSPIVHTLERIVQVIPLAVKAIILVLGLLLVLASIAWFLVARTARYLRRHREMLLEEVGVLQGALLPAVPAELSRLEASVAYRPAEGLAAGGDFYDAFALDDGRVGIVVGDVAGHGKDALMHTALLRYTLRAYLEADLEPRTAMQVAGRALDRGFDTLATVVLAVYDPHARILRYACAGHPPPVFLGDADHVPVTMSSAPPIGAGLPTGLRQTTVSLPAGSAVCFFTDGLIEARRGNDLIGRLGLVEIIRGLGPRATAAEVLDRVAAVADRVDDDMAACMFRVADGDTAAGSSRVEELEVRRGEPLDVTLRRFLVVCGVGSPAISNTILRAEQCMRKHLGAIVQVSIDAGATTVDVRPANVESFASAEARRDATAYASARGR